MSGLPSGSGHQIFHLPGFMKAQVGLASLLLIVQPLCAFSALQSQSNPSGQAGAAPVSEPKFRILRSVSGSKSSQEGGNFVIQDPRTVFYLPEDRQVIVYFEWEGPPGLHHLEGMWKNPEGKVVVVSDFDYEAKQRRFAGYWTLPLTEGVTPGLWGLEAHVDGEVAGAHTFQITTGTHPTPVPERHPLGASEIYRKALASTVSIEALDSSGARLNFGSGFFIGKDTLLTGFEIIDGAGSVRLTFPDGRRQTVEGIVSWSRLEDWVILTVASDDIPSLPLAGPNSWQVGDQCFSLDSEQEGNRTLVDGDITGQRDFPDVGNRLNLSFALTAKANGSPLLNELRRSSRHLRPPQPPPRLGLGGRDEVWFPNQHVQRCAVSGKARCARSSCPPASPGYDAAVFFRTRAEGLVHASAGGIPRYPTRNDCSPGRASGTFSGTGRREVRV